MPVTITIRDIPVTFPFEPYNVQKDYMDKVLVCLQNKTHGILESPTGTGKTLSLLCASLGWLTSKVEEINSIQTKAKETADEEDRVQNDEVGSPVKENIKMVRPQIIYTSRTHSQLTQAIAELRRTHYAYVNTAVLGSRGQLCINPTVSEEKNDGVKISKCRAAVKHKSCLYHLSVEQAKNDPVFHEEVLDIEDLVRAGRKLTTCPYYISRDLKSRADIVFMPYQYVLDKFIRKQLEMKLENCVVILDEGHNVEKICEDSSSFELSWSDITTCVAELNQIMEALPKIEEYASKPVPFSTADVTHLKCLFCALESAVDEIALLPSDKSARFNGHFMFELLEKARISYSNFTFVDVRMTLIIEWINCSDAVGLQHLGAGLTKLQKCLQIVFTADKCSIQEHKRLVSESYKVYVTLESKSRRRPDSRYIRDDKPEKPDAKVISFWCFNPAFGMRALVQEGVHSIILTSGTLSPLEPLISELGILMDETLENGHVITKEQVFVGVLQTGPDKHPLNSSFRTRNDPAYVQSLGRTIQNVARLIPHGLLVFFPSYAVMDKCLIDWRSSGLWDAINRTKEICVEPRNKREMKAVMNWYYAKNAEPGSKGACFMAVLRGKVSEGLDFIDHNGRGVIITGLPYPPWLDPRVMMKREYLSENKKRVSADQWYQLEATRAVNQAIGRVIRHKNDYGVILLCDTRFSSLGIQKDLSSWLRDQVKIIEGFPQLPRPLAVFFQNAKEKLPQSEIKPMTAECSDDSDDDQRHNISVITSSSTSDYMEKRYSGKFAKRYHESYLRSKVAWTNKRWTASSRPYRYRGNTQTPQSPAIKGSSENTPTQSVTQQSVSRNESFGESSLTDCSSNCSSGESCGNLPGTVLTSDTRVLASHSENTDTGVVASHSENTGRRKYTLSIAKPSADALPYSRNSRGEKQLPAQESTVSVKMPTKASEWASTKPATSARSINLPKQELSSAAVTETANSSVYFGDLTANQLTPEDYIMLDVPDSA